MTNESLRYGRSEPRQYILMEVVGDGPKFMGKYDTFLCPYSDWPTFLGEMFDGIEDRLVISNIRFSFMEMTDEEREDFCDMFEIEWEMSITKCALSESRCKSCSTPYIDHMGIQGTCSKLQDALSALKVIKTWATFRDGVELTPEHVAKLCDEVLKASVTT